MSRKVRRERKKVLCDSLGEWNTFIETIKFADVDSDGDIDIMLINNGDPKLPAGSYLRNNGRMQFTFVKAAKGSNIQRLPQSAFKK